jgi:hypothetical protein
MRPSTSWIPPGAQLDVINGPVAVALSACGDQSWMPVQLLGLFAQGILDAHDGLLSE